MHNFVLGLRVTEFGGLVGMKDGQHIRFSGEGDQEPGLEPGDIIIVLEEREHETFERHGGCL